VSRQTVMRNGARCGIPSPIQKCAAAALLMVFIEGFAKALSEFLRFQLKQEAVDQGQVLAVHTLDLVVQNGLQLFGLNWHWLQRRFHGAKIAAFAMFGSPFVGQVLRAFQFNSSSTGKTGSGR